MEQTNELTFENLKLVSNEDELIINMRQSGMSYREIGKAIGCTGQNVELKISRIVRDNPGLEETLRGWPNRLLQEDVGIVKKLTDEELAAKNLISIFQVKNERKEKRKKKKSVSSASKRRRFIIENLFGDYLPGHNFPNLEYFLKKKLGLDKAKVLTSFYIEGELIPVDKEGEAYSRLKRTLFRQELQGMITEEDIAWLEKGEVIKCRK